MSRTGTDEAERVTEVPGPAEGWAGDRRGGSTLRLRRRWMALLVGVVALVVLGPRLWTALSGAEKIPPERFADVLGLAAGSGGPPVAGVAHHVAVSSGPYPDVRVISMRPELGEGSVAAATVSVCRTRPGGPRIGTSEGDLAEFCSEATPVEGADLGALDALDDLVLTVVPLLDQSVLVTGIEVTYEDGRERSEFVDGYLIVGGDETPGNQGTGPGD